MTDDLISRQAVIEELHRCFSSDGFDSDGYWWHSARVMQAIANVPSVPQKTGRWIPIKPLLTAARCSECKSAFSERTNYCPRCGARMEISR